MEEEEGVIEPPSFRQVIIDQESDEGSTNRPKDNIVTNPNKEYLESYEKRHYIEDYCKKYENTIDINLKTGDGMSLDYEVLKRGVKMLVTNLRGEVGKVKVSLGVLLRSKTTGQLRYYYPGQGTNLLSDPFILENKSDGKLLLRTLSEIDLDAVLNRQYVDSDWELVQICNVRFLAYFQR